MNSIFPENPNMNLLVLEHYSTFADMGVESHCFIDSNILILGTSVTVTFATHLLVAL